GDEVARVAGDVIEKFFHVYNSGLLRAFNPSGKIPTYFRRASAVSSLPPQHSYFENCWPII
ncbi:MAG: hypothetical protein AAF289_22670, partial [Cyanobacteria bacterium P01_A01_bin.135]